MNKELKKTLLQMSVGLVLYELALMLLAIPLAKPLGYSLLSLELGILVGALAALGMLFDMAYVSYDVISSNSQGYAHKTTILRSMLRKVILLIIIAIFWTSPYVNVLALIIAVLGMKFGAYLTPLIKKLIR